MNKEKIGPFVLILIAIISVIGVLFIDPIPQDITYHNFSDKDTIFTIPNFWNVISNLPFLIVGIAGLINLKTIDGPKLPYAIFFIGVSLTSFGSAYYHWDPNNTTLIWDRLPMTIAFMALFSIIISEFINLKKGQLLLIPLVTVGLASVLYWMAYDDLRIYALIQFYPMLTIPIILIVFKPKYSNTLGYWLLLICYIAAKLLEHFDYQTHDTLTIISGHTLKHVIAAIGVGFLLYHYMKRTEIVYKT